MRLRCLSMKVSKIRMLGSLIIGRTLREVLNSELWDMRILVVQESNWVEKGPHQSHHLMERLAQSGHEVRVIDFDILWREKKEKRILARRKVFLGVHKAIDCDQVTVIRPTILQLPVMEYLSLAVSHRREIFSDNKWHVR